MAFFLHNLAHVDLSWTSLACQHSTGFLLSSPVSPNPAHPISPTAATLEISVPIDSIIEFHTKLGLSAYILLEPRVTYPP